jgi:hypothetical protein
MGPSCTPGYTDACTRSQTESIVLLVQKSQVTGVQQFKPLALPGYL